MGVGGSGSAADTLWDDFRRTGDSALRNRLILRYAPLAAYVAGRIRASMPSHCDVADFVSAGTFGLIDAIERFEPDRAVKFETYAVSRIRGAILDELRALDWLPRSLRQKSGEIGQACTALEQRLGRTPTEPEVAAELDLTVAELRQVSSKLSLADVAALDELLYLPVRADDGIPLREALADDHALDPVALFEDREVRAMLARAIEELPERDKTVVTLHHFQEMTLAQIGKVLGVTESRICQIHTKAMRTLRGSLSGQGVTRPGSPGRRAKRRDQTTQDVTT